MPNFNQSTKNVHLYSAFSITSQMKMPATSMHGAESYVLNH